MCGAHVERHKPSSDRRELARLEVRDEDQDHDGMVPPGTGPARAASLAAGGSQAEVQRELDERSAWTDGEASGRRTSPLQVMKRPFPLHQVWGSVSRMTLDRS